MSLVIQEAELDLAYILNLLHAGEIIALPTETVYGLACDAHNEKAVEKIYQAKGRPSCNPLIAHICDIAMAERYCIIDDASRYLMEKFWPGPLSLVLPLRQDALVAKNALAGLKSIALRCPIGIFNNIIAAFGAALFAPSANKSGYISPSSAQLVQDSLGARLPFILDGGVCKFGLESTIIKIEGDKLVILRPGAVSSDELAFALQDFDRELSIIDNKGQNIEAPGMLSSHYAPNSLLRLNATEVKEGEVLLAFGQQNCRNVHLAKYALNLSKEGDLFEAARNLFDYMAKLDKFCAKAIAVQSIPMTGIGIAINDRLRRAAAPRERKV